MLQYRWGGGATRVGLPRGRDPEHPVIARAIRAEGYDGGLTILWEYIRRKRPLRASKAALRADTAATGACAETFSNAS